MNIENTKEANQAHLRRDGVTTECYHGSCPYHDRGEPLCYEGRCRASPDDLKKYELERKLKAQGYDLDELDMDNPYNGWVYEG